MAVYDTYSRRKRRAENGEPDVYVYDFVSNVLRGQAVHICSDALGGDHSGPWKVVHSMICREKGIPSLKLNLNLSRYSERDDCLAYIKEEDDVDAWLDLVEICFVTIQRLERVTPHQREMQGIVQEPQDAIEELNTRFQQAAFGYRFEGGQIVRIDSEMMHAEVVKPALVLLSDPRFASANEEYLAAHGHYRAGEHEDAVVDANCAFESTMKTICEIKGWNHDKGARAADLLRVLRKNKFLPDYMDKSFDQLAATLQSGLPQVRNEEGAHGRGTKPEKTPDYIAAYALHLAAAKIVLLVGMLNG